MFPPKMKDDFSSKETKNDMSPSMDKIKDAIGVLGEFVGDLMGENKADFDRKEKALILAIKTMEDYAKLKAENEELKKSYRADAVKQLRQEVKKWKVIADHCKHTDSDYTELKEKHQVLLDKITVGKVEWLINMEHICAFNKGRRLKLAQAIVKLLLGEK